LRPPAAEVLRTPSGRTQSRFTDLIHVIVSRQAAARLVSGRNAAVAPGATPQRSLSVPPHLPVSCEARCAAALGAEGDEAISIRGVGDCFASLAMTFGAVPWNDFAFALRTPRQGAPRMRHAEDAGDIAAPGKPALNPRPRSLFTRASVVRDSILCSDRA